MQPSYTLVETTADVASFQAELEKVKSVGFDLETYGLDCFVDDIRLAQFEVGGHVYIINLDQGNKYRDYFEYFISLLDGTDKTVIAHNAKFDSKFVYANTGILLKNIFDTQIAELVLTAGKYPRQEYSPLSKLVETYCNEVLDKNIRLEFVESEVITEEMLQYAMRDVLFLRQIMELQIGEAINLGMKDVLDLEMSLAPIVTLMEYDGILLNWDEWSRIAHENQERFDEIQPMLIKTLIDNSWSRVSQTITDGITAYEAYSIPVPKTKNTKKPGNIDQTFLLNLTNEVFIKKHLYEIFNLNSPAQLLRILQLCELTYDGVLILNTRAATLEGLDADPLGIVDMLLQYRELGKKLSTYGLNWAEYIHPKTGRIHTGFNQVGTVTGRWSSNSPNLQNIPHDARYRSCFIARPGYKLVTADYSQAELRFVGAISNEEEIIRAYQNGEDIHAKTASIIFGKPIEEVTDAERSRGKTINFSILYGSTAFGVSKKNPDISLEEAEELLSRFFAGYPRLAKFVTTQSKKIWQEKISRTPMGRIRFFEDKILFGERELQKYVAAMQREGFNHIIQGGSADSLKIAMVYGFYNSPFDHDDFRFLIQVHDEVVVEIKDDILDEAIPYLTNCMEIAEQIFIGDIPAKADYLISSHWAKEKEVIEDEE